MAVIYRGKGAFLGGVPGRNLSDDEVEMFGRGRLLSSGLYFDDKPKQKPVRRRISIEVEPEQEEQHEQTEEVKDNA